jgi:hypothetical protein
VHRFDPSEIWVPWVHRFLAGDRSLQSEKLVVYWTYTSLPLVAGGNDDDIQKTFGRLGRWVGSSMMDPVLIDSSSGALVASLRPVYLE